jgi:hypothetical protein
MGSNSSKKNYFKEKEDLRIKASMRYDLRIKIYNSLDHGNFEDYIERCRKQYELECIPKSCDEDSKPYENCFDY